MQSFVDLVNEMRELRSMQLLPADVIILLRPVQKWTGRRRMMTSAGRSCILLSSRISFTRSTNDCMNDPLGPTLQTRTAILRLVACTALHYRPRTCNTIKHPTSY
jgi:hypothetical protein